MKQTLLDVALPKERERERERRTFGAILVVIKNTETPEIMSPYLTASYDRNY